MGWRDKTELQIAMDQLMYFLLLCALVLGIIVFAVDGMKFSPALLLYAVSVGVAIIPEGLPAVVTVTMSLGVARMAKQKAIVRKLSALEALGQVTDICSDKTGTLTEGKMTSTRYFIAASSKEYRVSGRGLNPTGKIRELELDELISHEQITAEKPHYLLALNCALNVTCDLFVDDASGAWKSTGDPTEVALLVLSRKMLEAPPEDYEFAAEHPFDPSIKRMSVVFLHRKSRTFHVFAKGALERVLQVCGSVCGSEVELSVKADEAEDVMEEMASDAMRVLAFGWKQVAISGDGELDGAADEVLSRFAPELKNREVAESGMEFLGVVGMYDPPRPETKPSVGICHEAGINVRMATGDHVSFVPCAFARLLWVLILTLSRFFQYSTAAAVAREVDIILPYRKQIVMAASEFDELEPEQVDGLKELPSVLARCAPKTKVKLVEGIHRRGGFVAMTGDGSNDAPAIRMADVGIAMGLGGSEVTKQVASIVLTDDNFSTIVNAIAEGRRIFANITKFVVHLLASNVAEVLALVAGLAFRDSLGHSIFPMSPIQVLWLNLFTSSPIALALGQEKADPSIMRLPPRPLDQGILTNKEVLFDTFFYGLFMGAMSLGTFVGVLYKEGGPLSVGDCNHGFTDDSCIAAFKARGAAFALLTFNLLVLGMECRDPRRSIFKMRLRGNRGLVLITVAALIGTVLTIYIPFINTSVFMHYPLTWEWAIVAPAQLVLLGAIELYKLWKRRAVWWNPEDSAKGYQFADADEAISRYSREGFVSFEIRRGGVAGPLGREDTISLATSNVQVGNEAIGARRGSEKPPAGAVPEMTSVGLPFERERTITFGPVNRPEDRV